MPLATVLSSFIPARIQRKGAHYWGGGRVKLNSCDGKEVRAVVSGTQDYHVALRRDERLVWATCTCPYFADRDELCKHIWATILAADREGGLRGPRGDLPAQLLAELVPPPGAPASKAAAWRELLAPLVQAAGSLPSQDEILYAVDVSASLQRQALHVDVLTFRRRPDGSRGTLRPLRISRSQVAQRRDPLDRAILSLLLGAQEDPWLSWYSTQNPQNLLQARLPDELAAEVAHRLCATGRCYPRLQGHEVGEQPMIWEDGPPWELWLAVHERTDGGCEMIPELRHDDVRRDARELPLLDGAGLLLTLDRMVPVDTAGAAAWLPLLRRAGSLRVPAGEREDFLEMLLAAPVLPRLDLPAAMRFEEVTVAPQPRLRLVPPPGLPRSASDWPAAKVSYLYDGIEVAAGAGRRGVYAKEDRRFLLRDREAEDQALARLATLKFRAGAADASGEATLRIAPSRLPAAVRTLLAEGWSIEAQGKLYRRPGRFEIRVASGIDWFELHGEVDFEGKTVELPRLLAALRQGKDFIPLGDGSVGILPEEWLKRWAPLAGLGETEGDHLRFQMPQALLLDAWLADEPAATCDETFAA
ncbi:hypothetical protein EHM82_05800, partial [bacterium]